MLFRLIEYFRSFVLETTYLLFTDLRFVITTGLYGAVIIYFVNEFGAMRFLDRLQLKTKNCQDLQTKLKIEGESFKQANPAYKLLQEIADMDSKKHE